MSTPTIDRRGRKPSPQRTHVEKQFGGKQVRSSFYGGFVSRLSFRQGAEETVLYDQKNGGEDPFVLLEHEDKPNPRSLFEFWGPDGKHVALEINDPDGTIGRIEIKLKKPGAAGSDQAVVAMQDDGGTIIIDEEPILCPPTCP